MRAVLVVVVVVAACLAAPRVGEACSYAEGITLRTVMPDDGATGVPINTRVVVLYERAFGMLPLTVVLRAPDGAEVTATAERVALDFLEVQVVTPAAPLVADTRYQVIDRLALDTTCYFEECVGEPQVIATFTTGGASDATPPMVAAARVTTEYFLIEETSCGGGASVRHRTELDGVSDDFAGVLYHYYDAAGTRVAGPLPLVTVGHDCDAPASDSFDLPLATDTYTVRAVDLAGNEEPTGHRLTGQPCSDFADDSGGCSAGPGAAGLLTALAGLGLRRRRRR
jgi:MYXO-CTERM domain-containing protein